MNNVVEKYERTHPYYRGPECPRCGETVKRDEDFCEACENAEGG